MPGVYDNLEQSLKVMSREISVTPTAILVISGHWEAPDFTVMTSVAPPMLYDYSGFPEHTYQIKYGAPGSPAVARRVQELLTLAGIQTRTDKTRGFDHGVFAPFAVAYPEARVPILQLSIRQGYDPEVHLQGGTALAPLRRDGVLIVGSGLRYHNLRAFGPQARIPSQEFDTWLNEAVCTVRTEERNLRLRNWSHAPSARLAHPREDHLIPLMVAVGAAQQESGVRVYHEDSFFGGIAVSSFRFGTVAASS
jgi:aromatic ring-opening dioxygenase catalytic subunit (LigB family)